LGTGVVDYFNRFLMMGLILSYAVLLAMGAKHIDFCLLKDREWNAMTEVFPAVIISFGYHNLIPSLHTYFRGDRQVLTWAILIGSVIPLLIYLVWEGLILGLVPADYFKNALDEGAIATQALKEVIGASWILDVAQIFAFFAIVTSFLSVALSFVDFLADGLNIKKTTLGKGILVSLVIGPSSLCALFYPTVFLTALNYAGGFGAVILFGILPALMVWIGRYRLKIPSTPLVPGGKVVLASVIAFAIWIILLQIF
jgi:tyrosine-specific transport protein